MPHGSAATSPEGADPERSRAAPAAREGRWPIGPRALCALLGVVPLGLFVLAHVGWQAGTLHAPARLGNGGELGASGWAVGLCAGLLGALGLHAVLGLVLWARAFKRKEPHLFAHTWMSMLQRVSALGALLFVALHVTGVVLPWMTGRLRSGDVREALVAALSATGWGVPWAALGYTLGMASVAVHLGMGLWASGVRWGLWASLGGKRRAAAGFAVAALAAFGLGANTTVELATGAALPWPWAAPDQAGDRPPAELCPEPASVTASASATASPSAKAR